jgi:hypothetical protein
MEKFVAQICDDFGGEKIDGSNKTINQSGVN